MPFANYAQTNLAQGLLNAGITAGQTTIVLQSGQGGLFPTSFPFKILLQNFDTQLRATKNEIATCTNRVSDTLTVTRASEAVPASYSATTQTSTAFAFSSGDSVTLVLTAAQQKDVQDEITTKLASSGALRTGLTASRLTIVDGSGNEAYATPGAGGTFLASDLTFQSVSIIDATFGDGSDGDLVIASGTTNLTLGTAYNYSSINIAVGATLSTAGTNGTMKLKCKGTATISGTINLAGKGNDGNLVSTLLSKTLNVGTQGAGGAGGAGSSGTFAGGIAGTGSALGYGGGGGGGGTNGGTVGGAGGNGGTPGGSGGTSAAGSTGGAAYGNNGVAGSTYSGSPVAGGAGGTSSGGGGGQTNTTNMLGGGGGAGGNAGASGANLILYAYNVSGAGTINCSATNGGNGGGGANAGGNIGFAGGKGGGGGGGGGGSVIFISGNAAFGGTVTVALGTGGSAGATGVGAAAAGSNGTAGNSYVQRFKDVF